MRAIAAANWSWAAARAAGRPGPIARVAQSSIALQPAASRRTKAIGVNAVCPFGSGPTDTKFPG
ncbi:hypothetical protein MNVM_16770 [Mycobacterium novum]|uniref:Uncharacterized protein n=2 Tax=Mycobacteriaceae TaxID=1762 RepID=A0A7I9YG02_MYCAL|nr:hypothetical protein MNVM_16770 [Mycobacterium novum]GFG87442.1 hypothetical protein MALGJ_41180 [Mycolicibacter algericus]